MPDSDKSNDKSGSSSTDSSSSSTSQKLTSKEVQDALKLRRDEQNLFARFKNVAVGALERMSRQEEEFDKKGTKKFEMGTEEARIIQNLNGVGLLEGAAAGLVTFFVLRRGPIYVGRWVRKRQMAQYQRQQSPRSSPPTGADGYQLSDPNATTSSSSNPFHKALSATQEFPRSGSFVVRSIWFIFDVTLSLMMAASTSMAYTDTEKIRQQVIDMPLVQGTSLTSQALCDPIVQELSKIKEEHDPAFERLEKLNREGDPTPASMYLENIIDFAENCQRRRYVEHKLRRDRGLRNDEIVEIPVPGVPKDSPRLVATDTDRYVVVYNDGTEEAVEDEAFGRDMSWDSNFTSHDKSD